MLESTESFLFSLAYSIKNYTINRSALLIADPTTKISLLIIGILRNCLRDYFTQKSVIHIDQSHANMC